MTRPYFLWDYEIDKKKVRKILKEGDETTRLWLIGKILSSAHFDDVFKYLTIKDIAKALPKLRIRPQIKKTWERALKVWGYET